MSLMKKFYKSKNPLAAPRCLTNTLAILIVYSSAMNAHAVPPVYFQEPTGWTVGDVDSTYQQWNADASTPFALSNTPTTGLNVNPTISTAPVMGANFPAIAASSGGYYAFNESYEGYGVFADVFNHGGASGIGGPYPAGSGTRVFVQTLSSVSLDDISVYTDQIEIVQQNGDPITGGDNASLIQATSLGIYNGASPIGIVPFEEILFEFWLAEYTDDFRVQFEARRHSSFQNLRIDSQIQLSQVFDPADLNQDGYVDGLDLGILLGNWGTSTTPDMGELDGTSPIDGLDLGILLGAWNPPPLSAATAIPEPSTALLGSFLLIGLFYRSQSNRS